MKPRKDITPITCVNQIEVRGLVSPLIVKSQKNAISFEIVSGEKVLISGASGCGKSTLIDKLTGLSSVEDDVIFYNGLCVNSMELQSLYKCISYLPQVAPLVNGTVKYNLLQGHENGFCEDLYNELIDLVGFTLTTGEHDEEFLSRNVGDRGKSLSGGQRQRIQIINTLLAKKSLIILDEATSALDQELELRILRYILNQPNLTVIIITHNEQLRKLFNKTIELTP